MLRRRLWVLLLLGCTRHKSTPPSPVASSSATSPTVQHELPVVDADQGPEFPLPTGALPTLSCSEVRGLVTQVRTHLPYRPAPIGSAQFAEHVALWVDALGVLTGDGKSRFAKAIRSESAGLLSDLETGSTTCERAQTLAKVTRAFVGDLRKITAKEPVTMAHPESLPLPMEGTSEARVRILRERQKALPIELVPLAEAAIDRALPELSEAAWQGVILAGAFRAWLPLIDGHSEWAPVGEEASIYDVDLDDRAGGKLFGQVSPTLLGARVDRAPAPPLALGDVVLRAAGVPLGCIPPEQIAQVSVAAFSASAPTPTVEVIRDGKVLSLQVSQSAAPKPGPGVDTLWLESASGQTIGVLTIVDVHDRLELDVTAFIDEAHRRKNVAGLVLDLRGNGGGSMDGAIDALGHFLPGLPMFPLKAQGESVLPDVAPTPPPDEQWEGPVAALVDSDTASAAEMLAGALVAYRRGPVIGTKTFGKGCVQEYIDGEAQKGLLRLTTLLYALPDGNPIQRVGLTPTLPFAFTNASGPIESEANAKSVAPKWIGPDVRPKDLPAYPAWPKIEGALAPCKAPLLCEALESLSKPRRVGKK